MATEDKGRGSPGPCTRCDLGRVASLGPVSSSVEWKQEGLPLGARHVVSSPPDLVGRMESSSISPQLPGETAAQRASAPLDLCLTCLIPCDVAARLLGVWGPPASVEHSLLREGDAWLFPPYSFGPGLSRAAFPSLGVPCLTSDLWHLIPASPPCFHFSTLAGRDFLGKLSLSLLWLLGVLPWPSACAFPADPTAP